VRNTPYRYNDSQRFLDFGTDSLRVGVTDGVNDYAASRFD